MQLRMQASFSQGDVNLLESSFASSENGNFNCHITCKQTQQVILKYIVQSVSMTMCMVNMHAWGCHGNGTHPPSAARWKATLLSGLSGISRCSGRINWS